MASSISIPPRGSRSSSPRPPPHYKFTILAPDVYAPKSIRYVPSEDRSYGFCQFLMGKFESHFGMRCTMPTVPSAAFFGDFNEFEERFLVDAEYIVIVITSMSLKVFRKFYPRLLVFVTVRPEWVNRFIFVMVGDIMLEPSVDLTVFFHEPIFFKESGWEADIDTWKNLHVLLKVEWTPMKDKTGSPRCGDVVSIIQRTVVETEVQEVRTRRRTSSRRSEGGSTPGNISPPRPACPSTTASTPSSPTPCRIGSHLSKSTDSHLHVVPPTREKARTEFNEAGEAVTSSAKPSEEKRRSPFLGRRPFGGRAKILVEQDLPKPKVKIERAPEVQHQERQKRNDGSKEEALVEISSTMEYRSVRARIVSPERRKEKKFTELRVGTENLDTEVCIVENIAIDEGDGGRPQGDVQNREERKEQMDTSEKLSGAKRNSEEKTEKEGKKRKPNKTEEEKISSRNLTGKGEEGVILVEEKEKSGPIGQKSELVASNLKNEEIEKKSEELDRSNRSEEKEGMDQSEKSKAKSEKEKAIAMETSECQTFVTMTSKTGISSKDDVPSRWDCSLTSDYSSLNSSTSSSRTLNSVQSPPPVFEAIGKGINIEDQGSAVPRQSCSAEPAKKPEITDQVEKSDKDVTVASERKKESVEDQSKMTQRPADHTTSLRHTLRDSAQDPLHRPIPVFLLLASATALSPYYHSLSVAAINSLVTLLWPLRPPVPSTVAILPAAVIAALPEPTSSIPPVPLPSMKSLMSPFLMLGSASSSSIIPQNLYFFRVVRGP